MDRKKFLITKHWSSGMKSVSIFGQKKRLNNVFLGNFGETANDILGPFQTDPMHSDSSKYDL